MTAEEVKETRIALQLTQQQFAQVVGAAGKSTVANWENGISSPDRYFLAKLKKLQKKMNKH